MAPLTIPLKGGHRTSDKRLDRLPQFDRRSRSFPVREVAPTVLRSKLWGLREWLDQGQEGACVSFAWHHEAIASPVAIRGLSDASAFEAYNWMRRNDEWPGEDYDGTSVLAGAKYAVQAGWFTEYRWAFGVDDLLRGLALGPCVIGIPWLDSMFDPRPSGLMDCSGAVAGGHAIIVRGLALKARLKGEKGLGPVVRLRNSWGQFWGKNGDCYVTVPDLERLLLDGGDACFPIDRKRP